MDFIKTIQLTENGGFTKAVNEGARIAKGDYLLILNNDCIFETTELSFEPLSTTIISQSSPNSSEVKRSREEIVSSW
jgi:phosphotransferase system IIA component